MQQVAGFNETSVWGWMTMYQGSLNKQRQGKAVYPFCSWSNNKHSVRPENARKLTGTASSQT